MAVRTRRSAESASDETENVSESTEQSGQGLAASEAREAHSAAEDVSASETTRWGKEGWQNMERSGHEAADQLRGATDEGRKIMSENTERMTEIGQAAAEQGRKAADETTQRASFAALTAFDAFNKPMAKVMDQNRLIFQKMLHAMQEESLRFVNRRLECTSRAIEHSRECHGVTGLIAVQQEFVMDIARDYAEQTRRFADLVRELAEDGTAQLSEVAYAVTEPARAASRTWEGRGKPDRPAAA